ncbi:MULTISPECIES: benzoylformate decarboxylase [Micromonospora]|uniref:Benzoylformate decarboxylase n=1 Tax=Micromonospora solifontis TaxID=2487138 RepID=A0ABX9WAY9_9ACTN|nr:MULTISPECIES: benzoylformate decarboxylase [Micromonospora]NES15306.1 benzoylformate decarboxylase [Micromonospora sp. PPF5-17B]NES38760.1 benzoylformate decarboxylase [Micromonospora solifontis]NES56278.1 benzoylformate decarboxylase [Micromonospora sp. PPF5-6]RNL93543.1 benzoylformate decarboxylase [Micromonospora solifontis]
MATVRDSTYDLLRDLGLTTVFGNPGSTEETFLQDFPADFRYVHALHEASAMGMADGYAQATGRPAHVNLHTAPGTGNGMGNLVTAWHNKTPLIVTAGQQNREMLLIEPRLASRRATELTQPYVKWAYEPVRAQDIPAAFMRAYATAVQPPAGPVFLSLPMDDWGRPAGPPPQVRTVATRIAPDPDLLRGFAAVLAASRAPALVFGAAVDRAQAWPAAVALAERLAAPVWSAPAPERAVFPESHPHFRGVLPYAIGPLAEALRGHDTVLVIGAPVFRYYPYVPGDHLPEGARLLHVTDDPDESARAPVGESLLGDAGLALAGLLELLPPADRPPPTARPDPAPPEVTEPPNADALFAALARHWPADGVLVQESPSNLSALRRRLRVDRPGSYFTMASGGLGFGLPAAVGIALAERDTGRGRPVVAVIGDGSLHYSVQALWTAAQLRLPLAVLVPVNHQYAILKAFAELKHTSGVPALDLPGLDVAAVARGYGCAATVLESLDALGPALDEALAADRPTVLPAPISTDVPRIL